MQTPNYEASIDILNNSSCMTSIIITISREIGIKAIPVRLKLTSSNCWNNQEKLLFEKSYVTQK
ncbi:uncharacterized protein SPAPADRAFT_58020 [Spathaspora passalidarum NRRL Y-27907]|uniref:Uncharacterized protein n=1 Tax=Spathaspora passalidarum (strain NRRL Y-27907 / 11-Y1) TaxID=619300 RepID=G3AFA2_SPAPN|nr:uncharacterized protein SPAPADRAFT_58020 [Spathaspora passalidarum NRRL Y-27907]EGW34891.1 hypothetical protein SPAPADRAFT_58020 [Spathaspora passalidarum NRRL Y-27907]